MHTHYTLCENSIPVVFILNPKWLRKSASLCTNFSWGGIHRLPCLARENGIIPRPTGICIINSLSTPRFSFGSPRQNVVFTVQCGFRNYKGKVGTVVGRIAVHKINIRTTQNNY